MFQKFLANRYIVFTNYLRNTYEHHFCSDSVSEHISFLLKVFHISTVFLQMKALLNNNFTLCVHVQVNVCLCVGVVAWVCACACV